MNATDYAEVVPKLMQKLRAYYVFPEIAEQICIRLQKYLEAGEYTGIANNEFLSLALTIYMQEVSHDEHLSVRWRPEPLPDHEGPLRQNQEWMGERQLEARLENYGLRKVERLPGNVGYLDIHYLYRSDWGGDTVIAAMSFLANTDALILDLRSCTGGSPGMITLVSSYLFGAEPVHLNSIYWRDEDFTQQFWTLPFVCGQRFVDKPVYVLTSKDTFSGGEEFAYNLKTRQRAILVGETTGGGAHPGASFRLNSHFEVFIPIGRAINPITGTNWEGNGVIPDILVPQKQALKVAHKMALESIIATLGEAPSGAYKALEEEVKTALRCAEG